MKTTCYGVLAVLFAVTAACGETSFTGESEKRSGRRVPGRAAKAGEQPVATDLAKASTPPKTTSGYGHDTDANAPQQTPPLSAPQPPELPTPPSPPPAQPTPPALPPVQPTPPTLPPVQPTPPTLPPIKTPPPGPMPSGPSHSGGGASPCSWPHPTASLTRVEISTPEQLLSLSVARSHVVLMNDIDLTGIPAATQSAYHRGLNFSTLEGNGHAIIGLDLGTGVHGGPSRLFFGFYCNVVQNLTIRDFKLEMDADAAIIGNAALYDQRFENVRLMNGEIISTTHAEQTLDASLATGWNAYGSILSTAYNQSPSEAAPRIYVLGEVAISNVRIVPFQP